MTIKEVKELLQSVKWIDKEIKTGYLELQYLDDGLFKTSTLTSTRVQTSRTNGTENQLVAQLKLKEELESRLEKLAEKRVDIINKINLVSDPKYRLVLNLYYIHYLTAEDVADKAEISRPTVFSYLKKGIAELTELLTSLEASESPTESA